MWTWPPRNPSMSLSLLRAEQHCQQQAGDRETTRYPGIPRRWSANRASAGPRSPARHMPPPTFSPARTAAERPGPRKTGTAKISARQRSRSHATRSTALPAGGQHRERERDPAVTPALGKRVRVHRRQHHDHQRGPRPIRHSAGAASSDLRGWASRTPTPGGRIATKKPPPHRRRLGTEAHPAAHGWPRS